MTLDELTQALKDFEKYVGLYLNSKSGLQYAALFRNFCSNDVVKLEIFIRFSE